MHLVDVERIVFGDHDVAIRAQQPGERVAQIVDIFCGSGRQEDALPARLLLSQSSSRGWRALR